MKTSKERFEERRFLITSIIRLMSMCDFSRKTVEAMTLAGNDLMHIEEKGACMTEEELFKLFDRHMEELE